MKNRQHTFLNAALTSPTRRALAELGIRRRALGPQMKQVELKSHRPKLATSFRSRSSVWTRFVKRISSRHDCLVGFKLAEHVNRHNCIYWFDDNPHLITTSEMNQPESFFFRGFGWQREVRWHHCAKNANYTQLWKRMSSNKKQTMFSNCARLFLRLVRRSIPTNALLCRSIADRCQQRIEVYGEHLNN